MEHVVNPLAETDEAAVYHCDWRELVPVLEARGGVDALIVDAPYSERTHQGHDGSAAGHKDAFSRSGDTAANRYALVNRRRKLSYDSWSIDNVDEFVGALFGVVRGWWVSLTDHTLAPAWQASFERCGLYSFAPLACTEPGSRCRLSGDGPAQWSCFAVVARPRGEPYSKWGSLPGAYVVPPGFRGEWRGAYGGDRVVGGKPEWLMERIIEDYSRPGDLICDPCGGGFTTPKAALRTGRRFIGCDVLKEHAEIGARVLAQRQQIPLIAF